jgi:hypothetical protein
MYPSAYSAPQIHMFSEAGSRMPRNQLPERGYNLKEGIKDGRQGELGKRRRRI